MHIIKHTVEQSVTMWVFNFDFLPVFRWLKTPPQPKLTEIVLNFLYELLE